MIGIAATAAPAREASAANHREAPITALDHKADITDFFAFVSLDNPDKVTFILDVDPLLSPSNGPNYFPFDPDILYAVRIDNDFDAEADIVFEIRFETEIRLPDVFTALIGAGNGLTAPPSSPPPIKPGTVVVPPAITALDGPGSAGLGVRQSYSVAMLKDGKRTDLTRGRRLIAVPSNVGPRTMPSYAGLVTQGIYDLGNGIRVWAGTADDPFWIDLGAAFDTLNFRATGFPLPGVLSDAQDRAFRNFAADAVSGFNVNAIAIEVPIPLLTSDGKKHAPGDPKATIGAWGTTSRPRVTIRRSPFPSQSSGAYRQVQRMGNPLINELLIGTGSKDRFSMDEPKNDAQFSRFFLDPLLVRAINAAFKVPIPAPPRRDLLPLVTYAPPIAAPGTPPGPIADLLRLNTGVPPTPFKQQKRFPNDVYVDPAGKRWIVGFPNGRRPADDVTDITERVAAGVLVPGGAFAKFPYNRLGDGVNVNDVPLSATFPFLGLAQSGRNSRHKDPGEPGGGPIQ
jgi:hypothetical protein